MDDRDRMERRPMWVPWAVGSFALLIVAFLALVAGSRLVPLDGDSVVHVGHTGFAGFFFAMFILFFVLGGLRRMFWWGGYPPYWRPWRYRRYYRHFGDPHEDERDWEEWHRRAHERMDGRPHGPAGSDANASRRD